MFGTVESDAAFGLAILAVMFAGFVTERFPPAIVACAGAVAFLVAGYVSTEEIMNVFSNSAPITIAGLFILSGALVRTGMLDAVASFAVNLASTHRTLSIVAIFLGAMGASAFINNTPVVMVLIPIVIRLAASIGEPSSRLLIPLSYVSILGGTCTLVGTSTNILVDGVARGEGLAPFSIFEITPVGIVTASVGSLFLLAFGRFLLPNRSGATLDLASNEQSFLTEIFVHEGSDLVGATIDAVPGFNTGSVRVLAIKRNTETIRSSIESQEIAPGDRLVLFAPASEVLTLNDTNGISVGAKFRRDPGNDTDRRIVVEAVLAGSSRGSAFTLSDYNLPARYSVVPLGVHRHNHIPGADLGSVRLRPADLILLEGTPAALSALAAENELVTITPSRSRAYRRTKAPIAVIALCLLVGLAALNVMPIGGLALVAATLILVTRCIDLDEALDSIDGGILLLIFAMLAVGVGLENTGTIQAVVNVLARALEGASPFILLIGLYLLTSLLTELVTNNAVAVVVTPLAIGLAASFGLDARPLVVAVMFGASASFATPIGYQTNTLVYGAGNYRFVDFLRIGLPMNILVGLATCAAIAVLMDI